MTSRDGRYIIGIDTGGTFTDIVVLSTQGGILTFKAPTTPWDFSLGVLDAIGGAAKVMGMGLRDLLSRTAMVKHGSTVATNALIVRGGVPMGFITTRGFEDTPYIMRAVGRVDGLPQEEVRRPTAIVKPEPLVPKEHTLGVWERMDYTGQVLVPLDVESVREAVLKLMEEKGVKAIAVSLLHSWANPAHERTIKEMVPSLDPKETIFWSFGSDLAQVAGEYARANTVIINAYVGPIVKRYLDDLERKLHEEGFTGRFLIMQGNGGVVPGEHVTPIGNFQSGPAGGMIASASMGKLLGHTRIITTDMGGTSFDVGLVTDGYWRYADEPIVERFRVLQPIIDVESIGAGGGTIARVDPETKRLLVGPKSAAASPGPVCYDQGGEEVTVTDADLTLGILDPNYFLGGRKALHAEKAQRYIRDKIAQPLGMDVVEAAAAVYDVINNKMADLIRRKVISAGYLPEDFVLYAFGGAGATHVAGYAAELGLQRVYVFPTSPVLSAFGIAGADVIHSRVVTCQYRLPVEPKALNDRLEGIEEQLSQTMRAEGFSARETSFLRFFTMRHRRQTSGVEIPLPWDRFSPQRVEEVARLFDRKYEDLYGVGAGYAKAGIEISGIRVDAIGPVPKAVFQKLATGGPDASRAVKGHREVFFTRPHRGVVHTPVYEYDRLASGNLIAGPAIVESPWTTTLVPRGWRVTVDPYRNLVMEQV
jgi:N-methylhydantoinase A